MTLDEATWIDAAQGRFDGLRDAWSRASKGERATIEALLSLCAERRAPTVADALELKAVRGLRFLGLRAILRGAPSDLPAIASALSQLGRSAEGTLYARWAQLFDGRYVVETRDELDAAARIEGCCLHALGALLEARIDDAIRDARRAVRMARAEGFVLHELLASLTLARCRRHEGRPHLAMRILGSVEQVAPPIWRGWLRYEQWLSGEPVSLDEHVDFFAPLGSLRRIVHGAHQGERSAIAETLEALPPWTARELRVLAESIDNCQPRVASPDGWLEGSALECPPEIAGLCVPDIERDDERMPVLIHIAPGQATRRVLSLGLPLLDAPSPVPHKLNQVRTLSAIAHLATGQHESAEAFFKQVYGFAYDRDRHDGAFRVLLHRIRKALPEGLRLEGGCKLHVSRETLLPDTRLEFEQETLVLRHLAHHQGRASAKSVALALSISARSVQNMLRSLVDEGTCTSVREGNAVEYRLEDTTLSEPTLTRLRPKGLAGW